MNPAPRSKYDQIAATYDSQPHRQKTVDAHFVAYCHQHKLENNSTLKVLDLGCGTGNQLLANLTYRPPTHFVGTDLSYGMLRQARTKDSQIQWIQADTTYPPFAAQSFHFISNQFSYHHCPDKASMFRAIVQLLNPQGRFVLTNICPEKMSGWLYYRYFPAAFEVDQRDFLGHDDLKMLMQNVGFINIQLDLRMQTFQQDLGEFWRQVQARDHCSQLTAIPDAEYEAGLHKLARDVELAKGEAVRVSSEVCLLSLRGDVSLS